jgi:two-component system, cell cycle sensor histidine kinase and response regulator CckA
VLTVAQQLRVLLVEDSESDAELLVRELKRQGFEPSWDRVDSGPALRAALEAGGWDIVISDHNMPGFSSHDALRIVKAMAADTPFLVVSGSVGEEYAVEAMRSGASDFVAKTRLHRLAPIVEREMRETALRAEQRRTAAALAESQHQLRQVQKLEAIGRLAGGIAHDFNNLLTAIIGYADIVLAELPKNDASRADIAEIRQAGARAADLTRQLLAFSRQRVLDLGVVNLNDVVSDAVRLLSRVIGEHITVKTHLDRDLWSVKADPTQAGQVIMNLALNARDAMPHGGTLEIDTANVTISEAGSPMAPPVPGSYVRVRVRDSGEGIPTDVIPRIFEPFFTTKEPGKGTGLGLSVVYGIVQQSEGQVFVQSELGRGTMFSLFLPQTLEVRAVDTTPPKPVQGRLYATILLVEDEGSIRELANRVLAQAGYQVLATSGPMEALDAARRHGRPIDLLLTDVVMPGRSGVALASDLLKQSPSMSVMFMSGFTGETTELRQRFTNPDVLAKPFTPAALVERVGAALATVRR